MEKIVQVPVWKYRILLTALYLVMAVLIFCGGAALMWVKAGNEGLYEKKAELEVTIQTLEQRHEELEAESNRLQDPKNLPR